MRTFENIMQQQLIEVHRFVISHNDLLVFKKDDRE